MRKVSRLGHVVWWYNRRLSNYLRYRSPWVRAYRAIAYRLKPHGVISGGTDCDGMRYAGADLFWTYAAAQECADSVADWADGPCGASVVSGSEAREWEYHHRPDTRDRFAERMGY